MTVRILFPFAALALSAFAQVGGGGGGRGFSASAGFGPPPRFAMQPVTGAPYSGEEVNETVTTLPDGTHITRKNMGRKVYRDAEGRTRVERPMFMGPMANDAAADVPTIIEITDPVAGYKYVLDTHNKVAHRQALPAAGPPMGAAGAGRTGVLGGIIGSVPSAAPPLPGAAEMRPRFSNEKLGTQTIDGILVEGTRTTHTFPVGSVGNDREFSATSESWFSPELKMMILSRSNDPRSGENTFRINNLSRTPPDASLFQVPPDYRIVDEEGSFTIKFER